MAHAQPLTGLVWPPPPPPSLLSPSLFLNLLLCTLGYEQHQGTIQDEGQQKLCDAIAAVSSSSGPVHKETNVRSLSEETSSPARGALFQERHSSVPLGELVLFSFAFSLFFSCLSIHLFKTQHTTHCMIERSEESDYICAMLRDGTLLIWRVKMQPEQARLTPQVSIWLQQVSSFFYDRKLKLLLHFKKKNAGTLGDHPRIMRAVCHSLSKQGYSYPTKMSLFLHSENGAVVQRSMDIHGPANIRVTYGLSSRCYGHKSSPRDLLPHPSRPLVLSIDEQGQGILWDCQDTSLASPPVIMTDKAEYAQLCTAEWAPDGTSYIAPIYV